MKNVQARMYHIIGLMSGSSLDGLDMAHCIFSINGDTIGYEITHAECLDYPVDWRNRLRNAHLLSGSNLLLLHSAYGQYLGDAVNAFIKQNNITRVDAIASHGHTVFHDPKNKMTFQLGHGAFLAKQTNLQVVADFRQEDIAAGGQGAPIVPIADKYLFADYDVCINLGGIANVTIKKNDYMLAYDVCVCNQLLNHFANAAGKPYDSNGAMAAKGRIATALLDSWNAHSYFGRNAPKSLSNFFVAQMIAESIKQDCAVNDLLRTACEHVAVQINAVLEHYSVPAAAKILLSGGGACNAFLVKCVMEKCTAEIVVPEEQIIHYKEALAMAFMGLKRLRNEVNILKQYTGAQSDSIAGVIYNP